MRTGHHSIDEVRTYKGVSESQQQALSSVLNHDVIQLPQKKQKVAESQENQAAVNPPTTSQHTNTGSTSLDVAVPTSGFGNGGVSFSGCQKSTTVRESRESH